MKRTVAITICAFVLIVFVGCSNQGIRNDQTQDKGFVKTSNPAPSITPTLSQRITEPTKTTSPKASNTPCVSPPDYPILIAYRTITKNQKEGSLYLSILGGYAEGKFYSWQDYSFGDPPIDLYQLQNEMDQEQVEKIVYTNKFIKEHTNLFLYGLDGSRYSFYTKGLPKINAHAENMNIRQMIVPSDITKIPPGYYICVFGTWKPTPRTVRIIDQYGSLEVDLDNDGQMEVIRAKKEKDKSDNEHLAFVVEYHGKEYELCDIYVDFNNFEIYKEGKTTKSTTYAFAYPIDINGDGILEIFVFSHTYYDDYYDAVFAIQNGEFQLMYSCGLTS